MLGGYGPLNQGAVHQERAPLPRLPADLLRRRSSTNGPSAPQCPANDKLCEEAVWFTQNMLLGPRSDMDQIAEAIRKIQDHAAELAKA